MDSYWQNQEYRLRLAQAVLNIPASAVCPGNTDQEDLDNYLKLQDAQQKAAEYLLHAAQDLQVDI